MICHRFWIWIVDYCWCEFGLFVIRMMIVVICN